MKSDERILELPQPIIDRLREVIGRIRRLQWIKGSLFTLAAAVAAMLGVMATDAAFSLESLPVRLAFSLAGLIFTLWVAWTRWLRPLSRRISLTAVARWVENRHPELQERISTAVELLDARHGSDDQGSRELLEAVVQDAVADVSKVDPTTELSARRTLPAKWLAGSAVAVLALLAALWPNQVPRLLARALAPMADVGNAWAGRLRVLTGDRTVAIGDPLGIEVAVRGGSRDRVELHLTAPDGRTTVEMLSPDAGVALLEGETGYALRLPSVAEGFTAKVVAGKAVSAAFTIKAVPRPDTGELTIVYDYPEYTGKLDEVKTGASGEILAVAGTRVTVQAPLNRPVSKASVKIGELDVPGVKLDTAPAAPTVEWTTVLTPNLDAVWSLHLEDADAITNRPVEFPIKAIADLPPVITLETPVEDRMELRPVEKVALTYSVKEDIGLSAVQIRVRPQDQPEYLMAPEPLPEQVPDNPGLYRGTAVLDLAKVLVPDGKEIRVCLMATDRVPAALQGPQRGYSREIVIRLNKWTRPQVEKNFEAQHDELRKKMEEVKNELQHARGRMNDKPDRLRREDQLSDNTLKDLESSTSHMQEAQSLLQDLTDRMKETAYARQAPELENIANEMVQPARQQTKDIPVTDEKEARAALAQQSKDLLENAIRNLEQEQRQMDQDRQAVQQIAKLSDIAEQQQRLAQEAAAAATPENAPVPSPDNAAPATATPPVSQTSQTSQTSQASPPDAAAAPKPPTDEQQRQWLEEQRRIAERAKQLMQENQNANPQAIQEQLQQAAAQAAQLAAEAEALAKQESSLASEIAAASAPEKRPQQAASQQELTGQIAALQGKAKGFQEASAKALDQSTETQEAAHQARSSLDEATSQARQSGEELTKAPASTPEAPAAKGEAADPASDPSANKTPGSETAANGAPTPVPAPGTPESSQSAAPNSPVAGPASADQAASSESNPTAPPSAQAGSPPAAGQQAAQDSAQSLADAAASLKSLGAELNSLAGMVAEHNKSLGEGAQQAGTAAEQAAQAQNQQSKGPSMQQGSQAAQQAADQLAMAANTAMQAMSIPANAKTSQPSANSKGKGKPQDGKPNSAEQPGQEGKDGLQMDTASSALPAQLAKLGLTQDDWMKLRSSLNGVDGVSSEQIPAEYRDLVKAYFGALATGGNASPSK